MPFRAFDTQTDIRAPRGGSAHAPSIPHHHAERHVIPDDVRDLIHRCVHSVWALELLLFLRRNEARAWTVEQLALELRGSHSVVLGVLPQMIAGGLVIERESGRFAFSPPARPELGETIARLDKLYGEAPVAVVREIMLVPNPKIQSFADAFKFRKE